MDISTEELAKRNMRKIKAELTLAVQAHLAASQATEKADKGKATK